MEVGGGVAENVQGPMGPAHWLGKKERESVVTGPQKTSPKISFDTMGCRKGKSEVTTIQSGETVPKGKGGGEEWECYVVGTHETHSFVSGSMMKSIKGIAII